MNNLPEAGTDTTLVLSLLGSAQANGQNSERLSPRHIGLLAVLVYYRPKPVQRATLQEILWDGESAAKKRQSLNQALYEIRRILPDIILTDSAGRLSLANSVESDLCDFRKHLKLSDYRAALSCYGGGFLSGLQHASKSFDDWRASADATLLATVTAACRAGVEDLFLRDAVQEAAVVAEIGRHAAPDDPDLFLSYVDALARAGHTERALIELEAGRETFSREGLPLTDGAVTDLLSKLKQTRSASQRPTVAPSARVRLIGRSQEIAQLRHHWRSTSESSAVVVLTGDAGIGKSRLVEQIGRIAALDGARVFTIRCVEPESRLPYAAISALLKDGFQAADRNLLAREWLAVLATLLPEAGEASDLVTTPQLTLWESVERYIRAVSLEGRRVFLSIDDYHWADSASRDLLTFVLRRARSIGCFLVLAGRGSIVPPVLEDEYVRILHLTVGELDEPSIVEAIAEVERLFERQLPPAERDTLIRRNGGRPFFLFHALQHTLAADATASDTSPDVIDYLSRRLGSLSSAARQLVAAAATLGRPAPLQVLSSITGLSTAQTILAAEELAKEGIVTSDAEVRFTHDIIHEAIKRTIPPSEQTLWHSQVTRVLTSDGYGSDGEAAYHAEQSGDHAAAARLASAAANKAALLHAYSAAEDQYLRWIRCARSDDRLPALDAYVQFLSQLGRYDEITAFTDELEPFYYSTNNDEGIVTVSLARFYVAERNGDLDQSELVHLAKHCIARASAISPQQITHVVWQIVECLRRSGELERLAHFADLLYTMRDSAPPHAVHSLLTASALLSGFARGHSAALVVADQAVEAARRRGDNVGVARACLVRGFNYLLGGAISSAGSDFQQGLSVVDDYTPSHVRMSLRANQAVVLMEQSRFDEAASLAVEVLSEADPSRRAYTYGNLALIFYRKGEFDQVEHYCRALEETHRVHPHHWIPQNVGAMRGLVALAKGDLNAATSHANRLGDVDIGSTLGYDLTLVATFRARMLVAQGQEQAAIEMLEDAVASIQGRDQIAANRLLLELAACRIRSGDVDRAFHDYTAVINSALPLGATDIVNEAKAGMSS